MTPARTKHGALAALGTVAAAVTAGWAAQRVLADRVRRRPDGDAARVLDAPLYVDHRIPTHDRGTIYVVESGDGLPILLSHGVTLSVRTWFHQLELLPKEGFRTIAYDHRGHGQSVLGEDGHSLESLAEDLRAVILALDLRDLILVGHSMGGVAVQSLLVSHPDLARERVRGVVLLATLAKAPLGSRSTQFKARIERIFKRVPDSAPLWNARNLGLLLARMGFGVDPNPSHVELVRRMLYECPADTRREAPRVLVGLDLLDDLPRIDMPTLVIGGTADALTPPAYARQIADAIPGARLEILEGGGHMLMLERFDAVNRLIADFAREVGVTQ